jgi:ribonuclease P protein component
LSLATLARRAEFLRVRGGARWTSASFVLEAKARPPVNAGEGDPAGARFGFTVTKKLGSAVVRNRIRRRLKEAARHLAASHTRADCDYVLIAREAALRRPFVDLVADLATALERVNRRAGAIERR